MNRMDVLHGKKYTTRDGQEKTYWTKVGSAFPVESGGYRMNLEYVPVPDIYDGKSSISLLLKEPTPRDQQQAPQQQSASQGGYAEEMGDSIPF